MLDILILRFHVTTELFGEPEIIFFYMHILLLQFDPSKMRRMLKPLLFSLAFICPCQLFVAPSCISSI